MCAEPAMAIARSKAMWPRIAVAMVRRTNLRILKTNRRFGFGGGWATESVEVLCGVRDGSVSLEREVRVGALDFRRLIGQAGSFSEVFGGGGSGDELISPMRRRVSVSWALVGTPSRSVLVVLAWVSSQAEWERYFWMSRWSFQFGILRFRRSWVRLKIGPPKKARPREKPMPLMIQ